MYGPRRPRDEIVWAQFRRALFAASRRDSPRRLDWEHAADGGAPELSSREFRDEIFLELRRVRDVMKRAILMLFLFSNSA